MRRYFCGFVGVIVFAILSIMLLNSPFNVIQVFDEVSVDPTLVIDAGHGGFDGGAQAADGTSEQFINLQIARDLYSLCGLFGENAVLTRSNEEALDYQAGRTIHENKTADLQARQRIVESVPNAVFLSIHLNQFSEAKYFGAQTFYSLNHESSKSYAEFIQKIMLIGLQNGNHRKAKTAPKTVFLMNQLSCPAVIVECGFLSNPMELEALKQTDYQKRLALCILCGYLSARIE